MERWFFWLRAAAQGEAGVAPPLAGSPGEAQAAAQGASSSASALAAMLNRCVAAAVPTAGQRQAVLEYHLAAHQAAAAGAAAGAGSQGAGMLQIISSWKPCKHAGCSPCRLMMTC